MRNLLVFTMIIACSVFSLIHTAYGAEDWGGNLGVAYWKPDWERASTDGETSGIWGPTASIRYKNLIVSAQYFTGEFDITVDGGSTEYTADRTDLDIAVSYRFMRYFYATVGYKLIEFDWDAGYTIDAEISGVAVGLGTAYTYPSGFLIYGSGAYMPDLEYKWNFGSLETSFDTTGITLEAGVGYLLRSANLTGRLGYRYQDFSVDEDEGFGNLDDESKGVRAEISFFF